MRKSILDKIKILEGKVKLAGNDVEPNLILVNLTKNNDYEINECYYNSLVNEHYTKTYVTDDYKKALEKYTSKNLHVIINDLPVDDDENFD